LCTLMIARLVGYLLLLFYIVVQNYGPCVLMAVTVMMSGTDAR